MECATVVAGRSAPVDGITDDTESPKGMSSVDRAVFRSSSESDDASVVFPLSGMLLNGRSTCARFVVVFPVKVEGGADECPLR